MNFNTRMNIPVETLIDDILARSLRLEKKSPYLANFSFTNLLHQSRSVINTKSFSKDDEDRGKYLLGTVNTDIANVPTTLSRIDPAKIVSDEITLYAEKTNDIFQDAMVKSISSIHNNTDSINDNYIMKSLEKIYNKKYVSSGVCVPYYEEIPTITPSIQEYLQNHPIPDVRKVLSPRDQFYAENLTNGDESYSGHMVKAIRKSKIFKDNYQQPLADTFLLIHCFEKFEDRFLGSIHFLEKQIKRIITEEVNTNLNIANRGPEYGIMHTIQGYVNLLPHPQHNSPWAVLLFAMRCGENANALQFASSHDFSHNVIQALEFRVTRQQITPQIRAALQSDLSNEISSPNPDTFKCLSLSVLSGVGGYQDQQVFASFEDWLWLSFQLGESQKTKTRICEKVYKSINELSDPRNVMLKGQAMLLVHKFDEAAKWFLTTPSVENDGLQIALAMQTVNLIKPSLFSNELLRYCSDVFQADGYISLKYISLIRERSEVIKLTSLLAVTAKDGESVFQPIFDENLYVMPPPDSEASAVIFDGISDPQDIINSYRTEEELENVDPIATHSPAAKLLNPDELMEALTQAGSVAAKRSKYQLAMKLFYMAKNIEKLVDLCCLQLQRCTEGLVDDQPIVDAIGLLEEISNYSLELDAEKLHNLNILLSFAKCSYLNKIGNFEESCAAFEESRLFTSDLGVPGTEDDGGVNASRITIQNMSEIIKETLPNAFVNAVDSYSKVYSQLGKGDAKTNIYNKVKILTNLASELGQNLHEEMAKKLLMLKDFDSK